MECVLENGCSVESIYPHEESLECKRSFSMDYGGTEWFQISK